MKKLSLSMWSIACLVAMLMFSCQQDIEDLPGSDQREDAAVSEFTSEPIAGQYIVVFKSGKIGIANGRFADAEQARAYVKNEALRIVKESDPAFTEKQLMRVYSATIQGAALRISNDKIEALRNNKDVAYIEQDQMITLNPKFSLKRPGGGGGGSQPQETPYGITRVNGGVSYSGSGKAWVIDSGVDLDHPDLNVNTSLSRTFVSSGLDSRSADDRNGHGSHVAGTIGAIDNNTGVIGVAAGATIVAVKVLNSRGSGSYSDVIAGVDYVGANGKAGDVANMSLGGPVSQALDDAIKNASAKVKFTLAGGNESDNANNHSPARVNGSNIYTISAMDDEDIFAYFSNYGNPPIDYCAPGVGIKSTYKNGGYTTFSGTSMAAPHAAGVLLLGAARTDGKVKDDPDTTPDPIISH